MELFKLATARPIRAVDLGQCSAAAPLACPPARPAAAWWRHAAGLPRDRTRRTLTACAHAHSLRARTHSPAAAPWRPGYNRLKAPAMAALGDELPDPDAVANTCASCARAAAPSPMEHPCTCPHCCVSSRRYTPACTQEVAWCARTHACSRGASAPCDASALCVRVPVCARACANVCVRACGRALQQISTVQRNECQERGDGTAALSQGRSRRCQTPGVEEFQALRMHIRDTYKRDI